MSLKVQPDKLDRLIDKLLQEKDLQGMQRRCTHKTVDLKCHMNQPAGSEGLHNVSTYEIDKSVLQHALDLQDTVLFAKLAAGDIWQQIALKIYVAIPVYEFVRGLDSSMCKALLVFHGFTGCDTVSAFERRRKKTAWNVWKVFPDVTKAFEDLVLMEESINGLSLSLLECFVVYLETVNNARNGYLYTQK